MNTLELLERLIAFDTVSRNSNLALISFVEDYLRGHGFATQRIDFGPDKANLLASIGPEVAGGLVLSGHTDVVPVDGQAWSSDPFTLRVANGRAHGRGTADMKGFIACALALAPKLAEMAPALKRPVYLALSCDEEVGCTGVRPMIAWMRANLPPVAAVFVGEPTGMKVVSAHKGITVLRTTVTGLEAHASCTHIGVNAIHAAARLVMEIAQMAWEERNTGARAAGFEPPYSTLSVGLIEGGIAKNIIPRRCAFEWEIRCLPGEDYRRFINRLQRVADEELLPEMRAASEQADIETEMMANVPGLRESADSPAVQLALRLAGQNDTARAAYATEAGLFDEADMRAVVCGPGHIAQAHRPDEFVELEQLVACERFLDRLAHLACEEAV